MDINYNSYMERGKEFKYFDKEKTEFIEVKIKGKKLRGKIMENPEEKEW